MNKLAILLMGGFYFTMNVYGEIDNSFFQLFQHTYISQKSNNSVNNVTFKISTENHGIFQIIRMKEDEKVVIQSKMDLNFIDYERYIKNELKTKITRDKGFLVLQEKNGSEFITKKVELDENVMVYSGVILPFLFSQYPFQTQKIMEITIVNEIYEHFGTSRMQIQNEGSEMIKINDHVFNSYRLKFTPVGIGSFFYQAYFWYSSTFPYYILRQDMKRGEILEINDRGIK